LGEQAGNSLKFSYVASIAECLDTVAPGYQDYGLDFDNEMELQGPFDSLLGFQNEDGGIREFIPGQLADDGPSILPQSRPWSGWCSAQVPESFLAGGSKNEEIQNLLTETFLFPNTAFGSHITGGDVSVAHDQMNAVPITQRQSGFSSAKFSGLPTNLQERLLKVFLNETIAQGKNFPGISEFNHICSDSYGPLKSDMTKPCPKEYSEDEKDENCYSMQESVWGVEVTEKLETIKDKVDPDGLFYCYGCIQSSKKKSSSSSSDSNSLPPFAAPMPSKMDDNESTSSSLFYRFNIVSMASAAFVIVAGALCT